MTCEDCAQAAIETHGGFTSGCAGCAARAASRSPHYRRVSKAGKLDKDYRSMLRQYGLTHEEVKAAAWADANTEAPLLLMP